MSEFRYRMIQIPISPEREAVLYVPDDITIADFDFVVATVEQFKSRLSRTDALSAIEPKVEEGA